MQFLYVGLCRHFLPPRTEVVQSVHVMEEVSGVQPCDFFMLHLGKQMPSAAMRP